MPPQILIPKYSTSKGLECFAKQIIKRASANSSDIQNLSKVRILPILPSLKFKLKDSPQIRITYNFCVCLTSSPQ